MNNKRTYISKFNWLNDISGFTIIKTDVCECVCLLYFESYSAVSSAAAAAADIRRHLAGSLKFAKYFGAVMSLVKQVQGEAGWPGNTSWHSWHSCNLRTPLASPVATRTVCWQLLSNSTQNSCPVSNHVLHTVPRSLWLPFAHLPIPPHACAVVVCRDRCSASGFIMAHHVTCWLPLYPCHEAGKQTRHYETPETTP